MIFRNRLIRKFSTSSCLFDKSKNKLNIAFFGSDEFSIFSFKSLVDYLNLQSKNEDINVDLIARHPKLTGRGLTKILDVPIVDVALKNGINVIRAEKKSEILDLINNNYDLAIAVLYGRLIPQQFIESLKFCGLNIHPSVLPKYSGALPLQFTLLNNDKFSGVTLQTLHPTKFDKGDILLQIKDVPVSANESLENLRDKLGALGGNLLIQLLREKLYLDYKKHVIKDTGEQYSYASKITPEMKQIQFSSQNADSLVKRESVLGNLHTYKMIYNKKKKQNEMRRIILNDIEKESDDSDFGLKNLGEFKLIDQDENDIRLVVKVKDGYISVKSLKFECFGNEDANTFIKKLKKRCGGLTDSTFVNLKDFIKDL